MTETNRQVDERPKMGLLEAFQIDAELVRDGLTVAVDFRGHEIGSVQVRPADPDINADFRRELAWLGQQLLAITGEDQERAREELMATVYARAIIPTWDLWLTEDEKAPTDVAGIARTLLEVPKLFSMIRRRAEKWALFRRQHEDNAVKS